MSFELEWLANIREITLADQLSNPYAFGVKGQYLFTYKLTGYFLSKVCDKSEVNIWGHKLSHPVVTPSSTVFSNISYSQSRGTRTCFQISVYFGLKLQLYVLEIEVYLGLKVMPSSCNVVTQFSVVFSWNKSGDQLDSFMWH